MLSSDVKKKKKKNKNHHRCPCNPYTIIRLPIANQLEPNIQGSVIVTGNISGQYIHDMFSPICIYTKSSQCIYTHRICTHTNTQITNSLSSLSSFLQSVSNLFPQTKSRT
ncbi:hypothetical protein HanPI659440_Chr11g0431071 [Helianthus annuus]|nr:hypothetical protein HanPI659440_Chr11g0431071 [Helianthus annuus]